MRTAIPLLHVTSAEAAKHFHCDLLGFRLISAYRPDPASPDPCYLDVKRGGARLQLSSFPGDGVAGGVASIPVSRVDRLYAELVGRGVSIDTPPISQAWGNREMYVKDVDGNALRFQQSI
jgi:uncharacterized glyoxalase superfamily protein PhnB